MFAILGGGRVSNYLNGLAHKRSIHVTNLSRRKNIYGNSIIYKKIKEVRDIILEENISHCVINWSITNPKSVKEIKRSVNAFINIGEFISNNPKVTFLFISSTSASSGLLGKTNYGISKRIGEKVFLKINTIRDFEHRVHVIRPGLIYGLNNCPIKRIINLYKLRLKFLPGSAESLFAVTSIKDLSEHILDSNSQFWNSEETMNGFYERKPFSMQIIHSICKKLIDHNTFPLSLTDKSTLYKIIRRIGAKIDLSLASTDRYPSIKTIKYEPILSFEKYLENLCLNN